VAQAQGRGLSRGGSSAGRLAPGFALALSPVLSLSFVVGSPLVAGAAPESAAVAAATTGDPAVVAFRTSGAVEVEVDQAGAWFAPGTAYFTVEVVLPGGRVDTAATWERAGAPWPDSGSLLAAATQYWVTVAASYESGCRANAIRGVFAAYPTLASFQASPYWMTQREPYFTSWAQTPTLAAAIATACGTPGDEWDWSVAVASWDEASRIETVRIPYAAYGAGMHELEIVASVVTGTGPRYPADWSTNPACLLSGWTDGPPATIECGDYVTPDYQVHAATEIELPALDPTATATPSPTEPLASVPVLPRDTSSVWLGLVPVLLLLAGGLAVSIVLARRRRPVLAVPAHAVPARRVRYRGRHRA